jgi:5-oxoprolinase (ATP-hydrolysing)
VIGKAPDGELTVCKRLSENPSSDQDAAVQGINALLKADKNADWSRYSIDSIKMGTIVATNALLERHGEPTVLLITAGFYDALRIGYQNRPQLFKLAVERPSLLYSQGIEVEARLSAAAKSSRH